MDVPQTSRNPIFDHKLFFNERLKADLSILPQPDTYNHERSTHQITVYQLQGISHLNNQIPLVKTFLNQKKAAAPNSLITRG